MKWKSNRILALLVASLCLNDVSLSLAQPQPPLGSSRYRPEVHVDLYTPQGARLNQLDQNYQYVVPRTANSGAYYTFDNSYYYTPTVPRGPGQRPPQPVAMQFGASRHLHELATRIEFLANDLCLDLHHNYGHNPNFREVYREAFQFLQATKFILNREQLGDREAIRRSVTQIDNLFHHIQEDLHVLKKIERRAIGQHGMPGKIEEMQALIHHLMFDQGVKPDHDNHDEFRNPPVRKEAPPPR
jgi:hypothetical protein